MTKFTDREQIRKVAGEQLTRPLCRWGDQPKLTAAQVEALLGNCSPYSLGQAAKGYYADLLKEWNGVGAIEDMPEPPAPLFLPIDRPVRVADLEPGDVLRFCYSEAAVKRDGKAHGGYAVLGSEVVFKRAAPARGALVYSCVNGDGREVPDQHCSADMLSFVRRPGFAKVRDGYVKNGDTVWWLGSQGPQRGVVGDAYWEASNRANITECPWAYQKAEPAKRESYIYLQDYDGATEYAPEGAI